MKLSDLPEAEINAKVQRDQDTKEEKEKQQNLFRNVGRWIMGLLILAVLLETVADDTAVAFQDRLQTFTTIFLGIFIEAVPFLLAGSLVSGFIEIFIDKDVLAKYIPRKAVPSAMVGAMLGFVFPVCECGVVPVTRRLYQKGLPLSVGAAFLLSAPVVNPVVIISTYVAFGWGPVLYGRFLFSILIAFITGLLFHFAKPEEAVLSTQQSGIPLHLHHADHDHPHPAVPKTVRRRIQQSLVVAADDFMDMVRYLIIGSVMAAAMQTFVPQSTLLAFGQGPVTSVVAMMGLAFVLSICSTVDAFLALSFAGTFTTGSILSFLVFGPMVDIKSALMFLGVFRRRVVIYLILIPMALTLLITVFLNLNVNW